MKRSRDCGGMFAFTWLVYIQPKGLKLVRKGFRKHRWENLLIFGKTIVSLFHYASA